MTVRLPVGQHMLAVAAIAPLLLAQGALAAEDTEAKLLAEALSPCNKILAKVNFELGSLALSHGQSVEARRLLDSSLAMLKAMEDPFLQEVQQLRVTLDAPK